MSVGLLHPETKSQEELLIREAKWSPTNFSGGTLRKTNEEPVGKSGRGPVGKSSEEFKLCRP